MQMKHFITALLLTGTILAAAELPRSIVLESGRVRLRLAAEKVWNINRIDWNGEQLALDDPRAHYGMAFQPQQSKYFIGSGHRESGAGEELVSLKITADGKEVSPKDGEKITGKSIVVDKVSNISDFEVHYSFILAGDRLNEKILVTAKKLVKVNFLYCFMHPWMTRFSDFLEIDADGSVKALKFRSDEKDLIRKEFPAGVWYDPKSGIGVVTVIRIEKGGRNASRTVWDRPMYRKDYSVPYSRAYFRPENQLQVSASSALISSS